MAIKPKGRADDDVLDDEEVEDDDLADDQTEDTDDGDGDEGEEGEGKGDKDKDKAKGRGKETNEERLARELDQAKKQLRAANREARAAKETLTKAGITDKDDPEDIKAQLQAAKAERDQLRAQQRDTQTREAIREVLNSEERYAPYQKSVKYIATELDLTEDDIDPDTGQYDPDALEVSAEKAVERYVRNQPKPAVRQVGVGGSVGGEPGRNGASQKKTNEQKLIETDDALGGVFSKNGMIRR